MRQLVALRKVTGDFRFNLSLSDRSTLHRAYFRRQAHCTEFARTSRIGPRNEQRHSRYQPFLLPLSLLLMVRGSGSDLSTGCDGDDAGDNAKNEPLDPSKTEPTPKIDEDCPLCRFFFDGPCRDAFIKWHACVQTSEKATDCMDPFRPLKECMDENEMSFGGDGSDDNSEESRTADPGD